jgi:hypothetical protein
MKYFMIFLISFSFSAFADDEIKTPSYDFLVKNFAEISAMPAEFVCQDDSKEPISGMTEMIGDWGPSEATSRAITDFRVSMLDIEYRKTGKKISVEDTCITYGTTSNGGLVYKMHYFYKLIPLR